jgi:Putative 8-oxoguanine DNA glycosylase OGG-like protein
MFIPSILSDNAERICQIHPDDQFIEIDREAWREVDLEGIIDDGAAGIYRRQVAALAPHLDPYHLVPCDDVFPALRRLFVAVMLWGFGRTGYGAHRTATMLAAPNLKPTLCAVSRCLAFGMYGAAYDVFRAAKIRWLGPSFATKYLYFCSIRTAYPIRALIFDSRVASALRHSDFPEDFWRYLTRSGGPSSSVYWTSSGYLQYLILMHSWASALHCSADQIEIFLFENG